MIRVRIDPSRPGGPILRPAPGAVFGWTGKHWQAPLDADPEASGALAAARLPSEKRVTLDLRGLAPAAAAGWTTGFCLRSWRPTRYRKTTRLCLVDVRTDASAALRPLWARQAAALAGVDLARALVGESAATLTPASFADRLAPLAEAGVTIEVLKPAALRRAGMGGLLAVGGGSARPPRLVVLRWPGRIAADPVVFVGKGITFDTGGVCIKPAKGMEEMQADMGGAAACAGAMLALARRRSAAPAAAVLALAENMTGERSYRPSDVLRLAGGTTVEVVDTDAEGRLVLADALAWSTAQLRPAAMVSVATLTGSAVVALGQQMAALFGTDPVLAAHAAAAGARVGEPAWRLPIGERHREDLRSAIADLRHCVPGRGQPDACHAAAFLREFTGDTPWIHLDIAGLELRSEADDRHPAGPSGFGVRLLDRLVQQRFEDPHR